MNSVVLSELKNDFNSLRLSFSVDEKVKEK